MNQTTEYSRIYILVVVAIAILVVICLQILLLKMLVKKHDRKKENFNMFLVHS